MSGRGGDRSRAPAAWRALLAVAGASAVVAAVLNAASSIDSHSTNGGSLDQSERRATMIPVSEVSAIQSRESRVRVARRSFALLHRQDIDAWGELWHERARIVSPYPPEGFPRTIDGKDAIVAGFREMFRNFAAFDSEITGVYPASDSDAVVVEYRNRARLVDGTPYTNENIAVFRFRDGRIADYHNDYDPRRFQRVVDVSRIPERSARQMPIRKETT